jgi:hypothetical protein
MKHKKFEKKLNISKVTISNLNENELTKIQGGFYTATPNSDCMTCGSVCVTDCDCMTAPTIAV